jgi:hypothetical protein
MLTCSGTVSVTCTTRRWGPRRITSLGCTTEGKGHLCLAPAAPSKFEANGGMGQGKCCQCVLTLPIHPVTRLEHEFLLTGCRSQHITSKGISGIHKRVLSRASARMATCEPSIVPFLIIKVSLFCFGPPSAGASVLNTASVLNALNEFSACPIQFNTQRHQQNAPSASCRKL